MKKKSSHRKPDSAYLRDGFEAERGEHRRQKLEDLAGSEAFMGYLRQRYPHLASILDAPVDRRQVLRLAAASLALAGIPGCGRPPREEIIPYVKMPERIVPGKPLYYATALLSGGYALGVLAKTHMGRPIKIEGNDLHPASLGATDAFAQASVLTLYDPDRSQAVLDQGKVSDWERFTLSLTAQRQKWRAREGEGVHLLTQTITSPTLGNQLTRFLQEFPKARWHRYQPVDRAASRAGAQLAFGEAVETLYRFDRADVVVSLEADFLAAQPGHVRYARDFASARQVRAAKNAMNRLYVIEGTPTITGAMADQLQVVQSSQIEPIARAMALKFGMDVPLQKDRPPVAESWIDALVKDLRNHPERSLIVAGECQPAAVHALVHGMNERLRNIGSTLFYIDPVETSPARPGAAMEDLVKALRRDEVETLIIAGGNPVYDAPADFEFAKWLQKVPVRIHWGLYADETAELCHWHIPAAHDLESWSDARAYDGTITLLQPLIEPLYHGRTVHELLAALLGESDRSAHEIVKSYWKSRREEPDFESFWRRVLHDGRMPETAAPFRQLFVRPDLARLLPESAPGGQGLEIQFRPDPALWDGSYANNGWLQELPKPLTRLTWGNAALVSPDTARRYGVTTGDVVELRYRGRRLKMPVSVTPGQADGSVALSLGFGRTRAGRVGNGIGVNAYALRLSIAPWFDSGLTMRKTGQRAQLSGAQHHHQMEGHDFVRVITQAQFRQTPAVEAEPSGSLYLPYRYQGYAWAMVVDLNACTGCGACVVACQAENNIPIVGREEVMRGREMHWLRIDRYYGGDPDPPATYFQPVPCMHCELAPCEPVCPVAASVHDSEGLNNQVYNRCVGTRFCQANCPYKVRRFNFFDYAGADATHEGSTALKALRNPDVTVRSRGVMEKCTYCVQRISAARIEAKIEGRRIRDGEVVTACQGACPTQAILFGDLNDPESQVRGVKTQPHHYALLAELNTRPRTTYLAKVTNPNPEQDDGERS